jgi:O-antigen/teichoic acid export membrane protein
MKRGEFASNFTRGAFYLGFEKGVAMVSTILYTALMARWLGPHNYGMLTVAFSVVTLATAFTGNFEMYLERYAAEHQVRGRLGTLRRAFHVALGLKLALGLVVCAGLLALTPWLAGFYRIEELAVLVPLLTVFVATDGLSTTGRAVLFGLQRFEWVSGLSLIFNVGKTVLVGFLWFSGQGLVSLAVGFSVLATLQAIVTYLVTEWVLRHARAAAGAGREQAPEPARPLMRAMLTYCAPLYGARLSFLSGQNLGKLVLGKVLDPTTLGLFTFAFQTVERFVELAHTVPNSLLPSLTQVVANDDRERLRYVTDQAFRLIQLLACTLSFLLFVYAYEIVRVVGSSLFVPAIPMLRILALVPIARTAQQPLTMLFQAMRRPGFVFGLALAKLLAEVCGYFLLLLPLGAPGACWANLGGAVVSFAGALWLASVVVPEGADERIGAVARNLLLVLPGLLLTLFAERELGVQGSLPIRLLLFPVAVVGTFALGLLNRYDLEKLSALPLPGAWLPRGRDAVVAAADRLARVFEPRSTA